MALPRPFSRGPYSAGPYSRYRGTVYEVAGVTGITFGASATPTRILHAEAISEIRFGAIAEARAAWAPVGLCETGAWSPADMCAPGVWVPFQPCSAGVWTSVRP